jgi:hypothetical protein
MSMNKKILLYAGLACTALMLAPTTAAAAATGPPATRDVPPGYSTVTSPSFALPTEHSEQGTVTCPAGKVVLSGGAYIAGTSLATAINASGPAGNTAWTVFAQNPSGPDTTFNVYAICATQPAGYTQTTGVLTSNPAGTQTASDMSCPVSSDKVTGGGTTNPSGVFGIGMTSSFPDGSNTWRVAMGNASAAPNSFSVTAVCVSATATGFSDYATPTKTVTVNHMTQGSATEPCTAPAKPIGGGNQVSNTTSTNIKMKGTRPFGNGWRAGENNDNSSGKTKLIAWAICA